MKLISWNVNGIRAVQKKGFLDFLKAENPDILCLQEIKAHKNQLNDELLNIENYNVLFSEAEKKGYSGVATYYKKELELLETTTELSSEKFDSEGRFLVTKFKDFNLYNVYFPSGTSGDERQAFKYGFLDFIFEHFSKFSKEEIEKVIICGDFNICHTELDIHHPETARKKNMSGFQLKECEWMDKFETLNLFDAWRFLNKDTKKYSWWSYRANARNKNLGWRIDYFYISNALKAKLKSAKIHGGVLGSDHCPVSILLKNN